MWGSSEDAQKKYRMGEGKNCGIFFYICIFFFCIIFIPHRKDTAKVLLEFGANFNQSNTEGEVSQVVLVGVLVCQWLSLCCIHGGEVCLLSL